MRTKALACLLGIAIIFAPFAFSCNVWGDIDMDIDLDIKALVPALDDNQPTSFETATFAMG